MKTNETGKHKASMAQIKTSNKPENKSGDAVSPGGKQLGKQSAGKSKAGADDPRTPKTKK